MPNLFADLIPKKQDDFFGDLVPKAPFGNVKGGSASSPSFAGVQSGSVTTQATSFAPFGVEEDQGITGKDVRQAVSELPSAAYEGLKKASGYVGKTLGLAAAAPAGLFDYLVGTDTQGAIFRNVVEPYDTQEQQSTQNLGEMKLPGQIVGGVASAAPDVALGLASGGEALIPRAAPLAEGLFRQAQRMVLDATEQGIRMSAPLAEKAATEAYSNRLQQGGTVAEATADALKAIASTSIFGVTGQSAYGNLPSRIAQSAAAGAATGEAVRELEGREFNPVELGVNAAMGGAFGVHGDAPRSPREAIRGEQDVPPMEGSGPPVESPQRASTEPERAFQRPPEDSIPTSVQELQAGDLTPEELAAFRRQSLDMPAPAEEPVFIGRDMGEGKSGRPDSDVREVNPEDLTPEERQAFGMFSDLFQNNASGESSTSKEAIDRFKLEQANGQHRMILNRDGSVTPIVTADGVDYAAKEGQIIVQANIGDKPWTIIDHGDVPKGIAEGRVNAAKDALDRAALERTTPDEEITLSSQPEGPVEEITLSSEETPRNEVPPTSTKNAVMEAERTAEGRDPIIKEAAKDNETSVREAQEELARNPEVVDRIVDRLTQEGPKAVSTKDEAILLVEKTRLRNAREEAAKRASDPNASEEQKAQAKAEWNTLESKINNIDKATSASGTEWGRFGQLRQRQMREDFSLAAMESRERVARGRPLTPEEHAVLKEHAEKIQQLQEAYDEATTKSDTFAQVEKEAKKERTMRMRAIDRPGLERLRLRAEESKKALESMFRRASAGLDPTALVHLARIGAYHIAKGAYKVADFARAMRAEFKDHFSKIEDEIPAIHREALATHVRDTIDTVKERADGKYTHKDVYDVAKAHIQSGVRGEKAVMEATAKSLDMPERKVRVLFSEYGKARFPSKDEAKTHIREVRQLVQLQESIDRLTEGKPALKSGMQRDAPTAEVREKRRQLNDLLKAQEKKTPPTKEELLRTYQQMRLKNLNNQIEDLNRQLANKKKDERAPTPEDTPEVKALKKERDELAAKVSRYSNPPPAVNPKDPYVAKNKVEKARLRKEISDINRRLEERDFSKKTGLPDKPDAEVLALRQQKAALIEKYRSLQNPPPATKPADPHAPVTKRLKEHLADYQRRLKENDFSKPEKIERVKSKENEQLAFEVHEAKVAYHKHRLKSELADAPIEKKLWQVVVNTNGLAKAIHTAFDVGAYGKQAGFMFAGRPMLATKNLIKAVNAARSPAKTLAMNEAIKARENYRNGNYKKAKLAITEESSALTKAEEEFMTAYLDKLPTDTRSKIVNIGNRVVNATLAGVRFSERFHRTFLNQMRADGFDAMLATWAKDPQKPTKGELESIADTINNFTGRGKIINGTENIQLPAMVFWAPRLYASRVNTLTGRSFWAALSRREPKIAAGIAWQYARSLAGIATLYAFGSMFKPKDDKTPLMELDPRSGDFGKLKFNMPYGTVVVDITAGLGPYAALLGQEISGERKTGKGNIVPLRYGDTRPKGGYDPNRWDLLTNFGKNRLVPWLGGAVSAGTGMDPTGKETTLGKQAIDSIMPITALQLIENLKDSDDPLASAILTTLDAMGFSNNIRKPYQHKAKK